MPSWRVRPPLTVLGTETGAYRHMSYRERTRPARSPFSAHRPEPDLVDPAAGTVAWAAMDAEGTGYEPVAASAVLPVGPDALVALLDA
jgi:hypothetical protein